MIGGKRSADVVARRVLDETLLVPVRGLVAQRMEIFSLNPVAALVWERLKERVSMDDLVQAIVSEFDVDPERARTDLQALIAELEECGLLAPPDPE